ncbi:ferredoxin [Dietzia psychralcaliphila]|uniref:ferredoxin n=1 Tax=Dietzia psychralcaliphila TaxID=139021 RepID=UPI001C1E4256
MIRVSVSDLCQGHGNCYERFPELFEPNDMSFGEPVSDEVTDDNRRKLRRAIGGCPNDAISMEQINSPTTT